MTILSPLTIGLVQSTGLVVYVLAVSQIMQQGEAYFGNLGTGLAMLAFLLLFVTSALISALIVLGYPIFLFLRGEGKKAFTIVGWSAFWLAILSTLTLALIALL